MKKINKVLLSLLLICSAFVPIKANEVVDEDAETYAGNVQIVADNYYYAMKVAVDNQDLEIVDYKPVYNFDESLRGVIYKLTDVDNDEGYILVGDMNGENKVLESSFDYYPEMFEQTDKLYYNGMLNYYEKDNNSFVNLQSGDVIMLDEVSVTNYYEADPQSIAPRYQIVGNHYYYKLTNTMTPILQGVDGKCVPTALAMLLNYYKTAWGYSTIVSSTGTTLRDNIYTALVNATGKTSKFDFPDIITAKSNIISSNYSMNLTYYRSLNENYTIQDSHINSIKNAVNSNKPVLVIIGQDGYYDNSDNVISGTGLHALTVTGVLYDYQNISDDYLIAVDPWNGNTVQLVWDIVNGDRTYFAIYGIGLVTIS